MTFQLARFCYVAVLKRVRVRQRMTCHSIWATMSVSQLSNLQPCEKYINIFIEQKFEKNIIIGPVSYSSIQVDGPAKCNLEAVVADDTKKRTIKLILALILGLPVLTPAWITAAHESDSVPNLSGLNVTREASECWKELQGVKVAFSKPENSGDMTLLVQHAGEKTSSRLYSYQNMV